MTASHTAETSAREALTAFLEAGDSPRAIQQARALFREEPSVRQAAWIRKAVARARPRLALQPWRVALLSSFSIEFLHDPLVALGFLEGLDVTIYQPGFDQYQQEILNPESGLFSFEPNVVILAVEGHRWLPALYEDPLASLPNLSRLLDTPGMPWAGWWRHFGADRPRLCSFTTRLRPRGRGWGLLTGDPDPDRLRRLLVSMRPLMISRGRLRVSRWSIMPAWCISTVRSPGTTAGWIRWPGRRSPSLACPPWPPSICASSARWRVEPGSAWSWTLTTPSGAASWARTGSIGWRSVRSTPARFRPVSAVHPPVARPRRRPGHRQQEQPR